MLGILTGSTRRKEAGAGGEEMELMGFAGKNSRENGNGS